MNLPNKLTMGRIFAIPVFIVVFLMGYRYVATVIFILAAITDMLDGKIARKYNCGRHDRKDQDDHADDRYPAAAAQQLAVQSAQLQSADGYDFPVDRTGDDSSVWNGIYREKQATVFHVGFTYHFIRKKAKQV